MSRKVEGYFTVEAAMVLPMVLMLILIIMYLWFFQYDRCLMEQDVGILALRGISLQAENNEARMQLLREQEDALYREKYIAWECEEIELKSGQGSIRVKQRGWLKFPFGIMGEGERTIDTAATCENHIVSPVSFIRNCRKIMGG